MAGRPSRPARLAELERRGYLAILDEGYRRAEGAFFCPPDEHDRIAQLMAAGAPVRFRGTLYRDSTSEVVERDVFITGFALESGRVRVRLVASGEV